MNNEEKNSPQGENNPETKNEVAPKVATKKLSGGIIGAIIGGAVALIAVIVLLVTLLGGDKNPGGEGSGNGDGNTDTKTTYVVTVVDQEGNAIKGAKVSFTPSGASAIPFTTDKDGKASYKTDKEVTATVTSIPSGYQYDKLNVAQKFDNEGKLTITITMPEPLVIKVVDQHGNPVADVRVQMCDDIGCRMPTTTDENGVATYPYEDAQVKAQLSGGLEALPEGYTVADPAAYYYFNGGVTTITLTKTSD